MSTRLYIGLLGVAITGQAHAWAGLRSEFGANVSMVQAQGMLKNGTYTVQSVPGGGARVLGPATVRGPGGVVISSELSVGVGRQAATAMAIRAGSLALPAVGAGLLIWDIYDTFRAKPDGTGAVDWDPGQPEVPSEVYYWRGFVSGAGQAPSTYATASVAMQSAFAWAFGAGSSCTGDGTFNSPRTCQTRTMVDVVQVSAASWSAGLRLCQTIDIGSGPGAPSCTTDGAAITASRYGPEPGLACPTVGLPAGVAPIKGPDGMCPTGDYSQKVEAAPFAEKVMGATEFANSLDYARMLREAVGHADMPFPAGAFKPTQELPATLPPVPGPVTTTTHEDGTVTEVATGWNFKRDPVIRNQGFWDATQTTTKKDANGNVTGTSTTGTTNPGNGAPAPDPSDPCSVDPGRLGCVGLGEPPPDGPQWSESDVPWSPIDLGLPAGCPAPHDWQWRGYTLRLNYQPLCDVAGLVRVALVLLTSLGTVFFVMESCK